MKTWVHRILAMFLPSMPITSSETRAYVLSTATVVRWIIILLTLVILVMSLAYCELSLRPPLVIKVDKLGDAQAVRDYAVVQDVDDVEVIAFSKTFLGSIVEINSSTIDKDLARALNMMTRQFQEAHMKKLTSSDYISKIKKAWIERAFEIKTLTITERKEAGFELDVRGILATKPLDNASAPEDKGGLIGKLYVVKVPRSERSPHGLLVSNFHWRDVPLDEAMGVEEVKLKE